jgi:hypothetical protein
VLHHAGRLIHDEEVLVFIRDGELDLLRRDLGGGARRNIGCNHLARRRPVARLLLPSVHSDMPLRYQGGRLGAGELELARQQQIETDIAVRLDCEPAPRRRYRLSASRAGCGA